MVNKCTAHLLAPINTNTYEQSLIDTSDLNTNKVLACEFLYFS